MKSKVENLYKLFIWLKYSSGVRATYSINTFKIYIYRLSKIKLVEKSKTQEDLLQKLFISLNLEYEISFKNSYWTEIL